MKEIWKPVPSKPHYFASNLGNIRYEDDLLEIFNLLNDISNELEK